MTCLRCEGFMVEDHCLDMGGAYGEMWTTSWRCMNCGCVHDAVIEQHQLARQEKVVAASSGALEYHDDEVYLGAESYMRQAA